MIQPPLLSLLYVHLCAYYSEHSSQEKHHPRTHPVKFHKKSMSSSTLQSLGPILLNFCLFNKSAIPGTNLVKLYCTLFITRTFMRKETRPVHNKPDVRSPDPKCNWSKTSVTKSHHNNKQLAFLIAYRLHNIFKWFVWPSDPSTPILFNFPWFKNYSTVAFHYQSRPPHILILIPRSFSVRSVYTFTNPPLDSPSNFLCSRKNNPSFSSLTV